MNIPWDQIIQIVLELIQGCMQDQPPQADLRARLRNPRPLDVLRLRAGLRRKFGLRGDDLDAALAAARQEAFTCEDAVLDELLAEAEPGGTP